MTLRRLVIRNLRYYWRTGVVVVFGLAIATAAIVGSMLVGDSMTGSLRDTATARLGRIDYALTAPHFFRAQLAEDLAHKSAAKVVPLVMMRGAAESANTEAVVPNVSIDGFDDSFRKLFPGNFPSLSGRDTAINASLAKDLGVRVGDSILVNVDKQGAVPSGTLFAHRSANDTLRSLRLNVITVLPDLGVGSFRLDAGSDTPRSVFVSREWLTSQLGKEGLANALVVESQGTSDSKLQSALTSACTLRDYGLKTVGSPYQWYSISLQSDGMLLDARQLKVAHAAADEAGMRESLTSVYLAKRIRRMNGGEGIAYSVVAAAPPLWYFLFTSGGGSDPGDDGIWLDQWAAEDLKAGVGDRLEMTYLVPMPDGSYRDSKILLTLKGIVTASEDGLVPEVEGITDAKSIDDWNTPFPVDLSKITERDEEYWKRYKARPKAFVSLNTARLMWNGGHAGDGDWVTSVRLTLKGHRRNGNPTLAFEKSLARHLSPAESGMVFRPIRQMALASAKGSTDFGQLFIAMSFFIVLAGAGLAGMLIRLSIEQRAAETGMMLACGFAPRTAMIALFGEGAFLTLAGTALGIPLGVLYAWGIIAALKSWWIGAVGSSPVWLHVSASSLAMGAAAAVLIGLASLGSSALVLRKTDTLRLLSGWQAMRTLPSVREVRRAQRLVFVFGIGTFGLLLMESASASWFGSGAAMLATCICGANMALIRIMRERMKAPTLAGLAARSAAANRGRSLLIVGLLAVSAFIIVTVAASVRDFSNADNSKTSGAGGFALRAVSSSPIHYDLASPAGRANLGFSPEDEKLFAGVRIVPFLMSSGEDISCLNLARPSYPRVLGVSDEMIQRRGFSGSAVAARGNRWTLLEESGKVVPVFGDSNTVIWNLHSGLGESYSMPGGDGRPISMRFAGLLSQSIFAGELLVSEKRFRQAFPDVTEPRYFLIETPKGKEEAVASALRRNLGRMGMEVKGTRELLNDYAGVQNTYLSMFLALGGLGLILGTFGLVAVLLRNALERRGEFALMLAQGFSRSDLARLLLQENAGLLMIGLLVGSISAMLAITPALVSSGSKINWIAILIVLAGMFVVGLVSCAVAARKVVSGRLMDALQGE